MNTRCKNRQYIREWLLFQCVEKGGGSAMQGRGWRLETHGIGNAMTSQGHRIIAI
jgi:hypothetical protein